MRNTAGGIDTRRYAVPDQSGIDLSFGLRCGGRFSVGAFNVSVSADGIQQCHKSVSLGVLQLCQALGYDPTVLVHKRHHVSNGSDGHKSHKLLAHRIHRLLHSASEPFLLARADQLEHDPDACQFLEGIGTIGTVGIDNGKAIGQLRMALMVVGHHRIHAQHGGIRDLIVGRDTRIHRDHQPNALPV